MTSTPSAKPPGVAAGRPPLRQRGFITSFGVGRVCADAGCRTTLSRYNRDERCWRHAEELDRLEHRARS